MINKTNKIRLAVFGITSQIWSVLKISKTLRDLWL